MILSNSPSLSDQEINFLFPTNKNERKAATQTETCQKKSELICTKKILKILGKSTRCRRM